MHAGGTEEFIFAQLNLKENGASRQVSDTLPCVTETRGKVSKNPLECFSDFVMFTLVFFMQTLLTHLLYMKENLLTV